MLSHDNYRMEGSHSGQQSPFSSNKRAPPNDVGLESFGNHFATISTDVADNPQVFVPFYVCRLDGHPHVLRPLCATYRVGDISFYYRKEFTEWRTQSIKVTTTAPRDKTLLLVRFIINDKVYQFTDWDGIVLQEASPFA